MVLVGTATGVRGADPVGPLRVVCSTPDLESLVREIGGARVSAFCFSKGAEDPHTIDLKPSFARELDRADLYAQVGLGIENAWLERLMSTVRNARVKPGQPGNLNLGTRVRGLEGMEAKPLPGTFHEEGNPHYLLDPLEGLRVAAALRDRFAALRPADREEFGRRFDAFRRELGTWLVGEECAGEADFESLVLRVEAADAAGLQKLQKEHALGGFLGALVPYRGRAIVGDHDLWPYFARRCGLLILGYLEPSPGVPPTTKHLQSLVESMRAKRVGIILSNPYFEPRHAAFVAQAAGAKVVPMAHQTGARVGAESYLAMVRYNGARLLAALKENP